MKLTKLSWQEYKELFINNYHIYNSVEFLLLNQSKCESIDFLSFDKDNIPIFGIVLGIIQNSCYSPFSSPFGGFSSIKNNVSIENLESAIYLMTEHYIKEKKDKINITLSPIFYNEDFISKTINCLHRLNYRISKIDLNYTLSKDRFQNEVDYLKIIKRNAKKNLNRAKSSNFVFNKCDGLEEIKEAYEVIALNRKHKGYPLKMSFNQVIETIKVVNADFFLLKLQNENIAASMVFHINKEIVQIIYWGDKPGFEDKRPMNLLSLEIFKYYFNNGIKYIDIGPSSENSIPNTGLCSFKESIGASSNLKFSFVYNIK